MHMDLHTALAMKVTTLAVIIITISCTAQAQAPTPAPSVSPAPAPAPGFVNITQLLVYGGDYGTFLNLMIETKVDVIFQGMANQTQTGITIFAPTNEAFTTKLATRLLKNLTASQKVSLVEYHALNGFKSLGDLQNSDQNQTATVATYNNGGGRYQLNITFGSIGTVQILSDWTTANLTSTVYSQTPVSIFAINQVLLPDDIFGLPAPAPAPAPSAGAPVPTPGASLSPSGSKSPGTSFAPRNHPSIPITSCLLLSLLLFKLLLISQPL